MNTINKSNFFKYVGQESREINNLANAAAQFGYQASRRNALYSCDRLMCRADQYLHGVAWLYAHNTFDYRAYVKKHGADVNDLEWQQDLLWELSQKADKFEKMNRLIF